ncbi:MAG: 4-hydroxy-tetrahydrodipicolinate reductase, partial [Phycisphaerae bacterium]
LERFQVVAALEAPAHPQLGQPAAAGQPPITDRCNVQFDVLIDFSLPDATIAWLDHVRQAGKSMVIGTTGHSPQQLAAIQAAASSIAILKAPNMSVGVNLLLRLVGQVAQTLGQQCDIEIVEAHHRFKADAPSGTALALLGSICQATGRDPDRDVVFGRRGQTGQRPAGQIGVHAVRLGDTVGQHEVHFGCLGETLTLRHVAHTRETFARGALRAAEWIVHQPPGLYSMHDVLFGRQA